MQREYSNLSNTTFNQILSSIINNSNNNIKLLDITNIFKTKTNKTIIGSWLNTGSTAVAELMAESGLDFVTIDMEHAPISIESLADLLRAIRSGNPKSLGCQWRAGRENAK